MSGNKRVCIIGSGVSGLAALRWCLNEKLDVVCYERARSYGGNWTLAQTKTYDGLILNISKSHYVFSDLEWPESVATFPNRADVMAYLERYVEKFNLERNIRYLTTVISTKKCLDGGWNVETVNSAGKRSITNFDYLIIATGIYSEPSWPEYHYTPYKGILLHSKDYKLLQKDPKTSSKTVAVVGASMSAIEICDDLVTRAKLVKHVFRRPHWMFRRQAQLSDLTSESVAWDLLVFRRTKQRDIASWSDEEYVKKFNKTCLDLCTMTDDHQQEFKDYHIGPDDPGTAYAAHNADFFKPLKEGKLVGIRGEIEGFYDNGVVMKNGEKISADVIVFATGYVNPLPFLENDILKELGYNANDHAQPILLYNSTIPHSVSNLAFICHMNYPSPYMQIAEMQSRWAAKIAAGKVSLPPREQMETAVQNVKRLRSADGASMRHCATDSHVTMLDSIADEIGVLPDFERIKISDPELYNWLIKGVTHTVAYRLTGSDAIENARERLKKVNERHAYLLLLPEK